MKELRVKTGGRRYVNEDFTNLQELALATTQLFAGIRYSFVLSGLNATRDESDEPFSFLPSSEYGQPHTFHFQEGFVYLDGRIRKLEKQSVTGEWKNLHIVPEKQSGPDIIYKDGSTDAQYDNYTAKIVNGEPIDTPYIAMKHWTDNKVEKARFPVFADVLATNSISLSGGATQVSDVYLTLTHGLTISHVDDENGALHFHGKDSEKPSAYVGHKTGDNDSFYIASNGIILEIRNGKITIYSYEQENLTAKQAVNGGNKKEILSFGNASIFNDVTLNNLTASGKSVFNGDVHLNKKVYLSEYSDEYDLAYLIKGLPQLDLLNVPVPVISTITGKEIPTMQCCCDGNHLFVFGTVEGEEAYIDKGKQRQMIGMVGSNVLVWLAKPMFKIPAKIANLALGLMGTSPMAYENITGIDSETNQTRYFSFKSKITQVLATSTASLDNIPGNIGVINIEGSQIIDSKDTLALNGYQLKKQLGGIFVIYPDGSLYMSSLFDTGTTTDGGGIGYFTGDDLASMGSNPVQLSNGENIDNIFENNLSYKLNLIFIKPYKR